TDRASLVVLVKYPQNGRVKTRLASQIGEDHATILYRNFVEICLARFTQIEHLDCTVYFDPPEEEHAFRRWLGDKPSYLPQSSGDLGERLRYAMDHQLKEYSRVIAVGSDSPDLPMDYISQAITSLAQNDCTIGPTDDGGYYLIGLSTPAFEIFDNIPWSTDNVKQSTLDKAKESELSVHLLPSWYDVDKAKDLRRLMNSDLPEIKQIVKLHEEIVDNLINPQEIS
ncbi:MAG: glycosyltransferase, partial [candidate division Zixibacteria bacterium]|nr:glycosyltransferase [candidate division Zixibacteria bacterium]